MKAKFYFLSVFILFVSIKSMAMAGFEGIWTGWGQWTFDGSGTSCQRVQLVFEESDQVLKRASGFWDCDFVFMEVNSLSLSKSGGQLLVGGEVVGSADGKKATWSEPYSERVRIDVTMEREGNHMDYREVWTDQVTGPLYDIRGRLFIRPEQTLPNPQNHRPRLDRQLLRK